MITKGKTDTTHSRRVVFSYLQNKEAVKEVFGTIANAIGDRPGGYLRIIKTGHRKGDAAEMAMIEFVDFNNDYVSGGTEEGGKSKKRRRRRGGKKTAAAAATAVAADAAEDAAESVDAPASGEEE